MEPVEEMGKKRVKEKLELPEGQERCCISHGFQKVALENPNKIAVIEASSTAQHHNRSLASSPPYHGDRSFTFSQLFDAVDSLSSRIRSILDGAHDPLLIKPTGQSKDLIDSILYNRTFSGVSKLAMPMLSIRFA